MDHVDDILLDGPLGQHASVYFDNGSATSTIHSPESTSLAAFAHEIRTPLATINATLDLLTYDNPPETKDLQQLVARLQRGVVWMNNLVENLDTWTVLCNGTFSLNRSSIVVRDFIEQAMALVQPLLERRDQTMIFECPKPEPTVNGDAFRLSQVMVNLLTNASRYGVSGDTISITVVDEVDDVVVFVSDHGQGIPDHECEIIFAPRVRGEQASSCADGQGFGLHIVADIVERHGGTVGVKSLQGGGTTFWVRLPAER